MTVTDRCYCEGINISVYIGDAGSELRLDGVIPVPFFFNLFFFFGVLIVAAKINTNQRGTGTVVAHVIQKYC